MLYVKGGLTAKDKNSIALVGSRMSTHYGIETARKLAYQLAYLAVTIVSGGARGIDTAAHQGALSSKGRPIAVLGTGLNLVFPPENAELFERITANGAVMTQTTKIAVTGCPSAAAAKAAAAKKVAAAKAKQAGRRR